MNYNNDAIESELDDPECLIENLVSKYGKYKK